MLEKGQIYLRKLMFIENIRDDYTREEFLKAVKCFQFATNYDDNIKKFLKSPPLVVDGKLGPLTFKALETLIQTTQIGKLEKVSDPVAKNEEKKKSFKNYIEQGFLEFPLPLALSILQHESKFQFYNEIDGYPKVNLDYNDSKNSLKITSRGFYITQRTIFYFPISQDSLDSMGTVKSEIEFFDNILDSKFKNFVVSRNIRARDDLRLELIGNKEPLRGCKYSESDSRFKKDCLNCLKSIPTRSIKEGEFILKNKWEFKPSNYHLAKGYKNYPDPKFFPCDYLFAIRRYNGSGVNSYHYLIRVLNRVLSEGN